MTIKVVRGNPTPEELAAALTVVQVRAAALAAASSTRPPAARTAWSDPARIATHPLPQPGPSTWARTFWPG
ncbi:acyl-CoA carboxylase subunit epsilon [Streptomyces sp. NPDC047000]|uniref:acyl-CoA carboxylase subunit epsilon n=1 Tax=Streptomyces sp. NPDC047000 TaxID=3155474 RepID=UPI00340C43F6